MILTIDTLSELATIYRDKAEKARVLRERLKVRAKSDDADISNQSAHQAGIYNAEYHLCMRYEQALCEAINALKGHQNP